MPLAWCGTTWRLHSSEHTSAASTGSWDLLQSKGARFHQTCNTGHVSTLIQHITEWFGLEGTFKGHLVQPPFNEQGHLQLEQVSPTWPWMFPGMGHLPPLWATCASVSPPPIFLVKNFFLIFSLNLLSSSLKPLPLVLRASWALSCHFSSYMKQRSWRRETKLRLSLQREKTEQTSETNTKYRNTYTTQIFLYCLQVCSSQWVI